MTSRFFLFVVSFIGFLDELSIGLVYPLFAMLLFGPEGQFLDKTISIEMRGFIFGLLIGLTPLVQFFSSGFMGLLSDRKGRRPVLLLGISMGIVGYCLAVIGVWFQSLPLLFCYRFFVGFSNGTASVAQAALADFCSIEYKPRAFSIFNAACGIGFTIGPFAGGFLSDSSLNRWFGPITPFIVTGFMCIFNLFFVYLAFPKKSFEHQLPSETSILVGLYNLKKAFFSKKMRRYFFAVFFFCFGWAFYAEFLPILLLEFFHFTSLDIGNMYAYNGAWYALSAGLLTAPLLKRFSTNQLSTRALLCCGFYIPFFFFIDKPWQLALYSPAFMFFLALIFPILGAEISNKAEEGKQGEAMGLYGSVMAFAFGISPILGGPLVATYPFATIWVSSLCIIISASCLLLEKLDGVTQGIKLES